VNHFILLFILRAKSNKLAHILPLCYCNVVSSKELWID